MLFRMTLEELRAWCAQKPGSREDFPFDEETLVWKIGPKMYGLADVNAVPVRVNLKCDPALARAHARIDPKTASLPLFRPDFLRIRYTYRRRTMRQSIP